MAGIRPDAAYGAKWAKKRLPCWAVLASIATPLAIVFGIETGGIGDVRPSHLRFSFHAATVSGVLFFRDDATRHLAEQKRGGRPLPPHSTGAPQVLQVVRIFSPSLPSPAM